MVEFNADVDATFGAAFIGLVASCVLLGIQTQQMYTYYQRYPGDRMFYKLLVALVWMLEVFDQSLICHAVYYYTITNASSPLVLLIGKTDWTLIVQSTVGSLVGAIVKGTFVYRIWRFSYKNILLTSSLAILVLSAFGFSIYYTVRAFHFQQLVFVTKLQVVASLALGTNVIADIAIAASLCFILRNYRTGYKRSDSLVNSLMLYAVNTGVLTSGVSLTTLILYDVMPTNCVFIGFYFVLSKLYAVSLLATLNSRKSIRGKGTDAEEKQGVSISISRAIHSAPARHITSTDTLAKPTRSQGMDIRREIQVLEDIESRPRYNGW